MSIKVSSTVLRVLNTRPIDQALPLSLKMIEAGLQPYYFPLLSIDYISQQGFFLTSLWRNEQFIFTSTNAVQGFFQTKNFFWPSQLPAPIAIGSGTAACLKSLGVNNVVIPDSPNSESLLMLDVLNADFGKKIILVKGEGGLTTIENVLTTRGFNIVSLIVYQRVLTKIDKIYLEEIWRRNQVDIILITSEASLRHLMSLFHGLAKAWLLSKSFMVISQRLANVAKELGCSQVYISDYSNVVDQLASFGQGQ